jgi:type IV pilus assembly protein PilB
MAGLDVAERRTPQEGQIRGFHAGKERELDVRVATMPTAAGEKLVLRLFDRSHLAARPRGAGPRSRSSSSACGRRCRGRRV